MTRALAWAAVRLSPVLVPAWIVAAIAAAHYLPSITSGGDTPLGALVPGGAGAIRTEQREYRRFGTTLLTRVVVVQRAHRGRLTHAQVRRTLRLAVRVDRRRSHLLRHVAFAAPLVSHDRTTTLTYLYFAPATSVGARLALADTYKRKLDPDGLVTGALPARHAEFEEIQRALPRVTLATVALIVLVLLITFRALGPPLVGLGAAAIAYTISVHVLAWLGAQRGQSVPKEVEPVLVALLLGLVTDYAVFLLAGTRRHLTEGASRWQAAERAARDNLPIIVTAALIVALGSTTLVVGRLAVFRSFGPGMAVTVLVTLAVAATFIPAALALLGPIAFWPTLHELERPPRAWLWRFGTARPVAAVAGIAVVAALTVSAYELRHARLGFTLVTGQPPGAEVKRAQEHAGRAFAPGIVAPTELLLEGRLPRDRLVALERELERDRDVARVLGPREQVVNLPVFATRDAARYAVVLREQPLGAHAIDAYDRLRARLPHLLARAGLRDARASWAGDTALAQETVHTMRADGIRIGIAVLLVNLVLLALFLRTLGPPLYLLAASVLALAAALGATTWLFQVVLHHDELTYYVPFAAGVLLLSLGSDYNVFVVGRIWSAARSRPVREAIATAAPAASRTITIAGAVLAGSFGLLALVPVRPMRELAVAMSAGILVDTFVVRSLLVPSLLALFAREQRGDGAEVVTRR